MSTVGPAAVSKHRVEPPYIVVTTRTSLPKRCVVTNLPVSDSEYQVWSLPSIPRWLWWLTFCSPILLLAYPSLPNRCKIAAGLSKRVRRKHLLIKTLLLTALTSPFLLVCASIAARQPNYLLFAMAVFPFAFFAMPVLVLLMPPLRIHRRHDDLYWISGCSPEFLTSLEPEQ